MRGHSLSRRTRTHTRTTLTQGAVCCILLSPLCSRIDSTRQLLFTSRHLSADMQWSVRWRAAATTLCLSPLRLSSSPPLSLSLSSPPLPHTCLTVQFRTDASRSSLLTPTPSSPNKNSLQFTPPTEQQLQQLRMRLMQPYDTRPMTRKKTAVPASSTSFASSSSSSSSSASASSSSSPPRLLSLDVGDRFVGVAVSDCTNSRALPLCVVLRKDVVAYDKEADKSQSYSPHAHLPFRFHAQGTKRDLRAPQKGFVRRRDDRVVAEEVAELLHVHRCVGLIVGMPLTLQFKMDQQCVKTTEFVNMISEYLHERAQKQNNNNNVNNTDNNSSITPASTHSATATPPFVLPSLFWWDERLTSSDARHLLGSYGFKGKKLAQQTDAFAAAIILQEFMNRLRT